MLKEEFEEDPPKYDRALTLLEEIKEVGLLKAQQHPFDNIADHIFCFFIVALVIIVTSSNQKSARNQRQVGHRIDQTANQCRNSGFACTHILVSLNY